MKRIALLAFLAAAGCTRWQITLNDLPQADKDAFGACYESVAPIICPNPNPSAFGNRISCMDDEAKRYRKLASTTARRSYLLKSGCPQSVVVRFMGAEPTVVPASMVK